MEFRGLQRGRLLAVILLGACGVLGACRTTAAQQNPFGQPSPPPDTAAQQDPADSPDPIVRAVAQSNPQTPVELLDAIRVLLNIDRDDIAVRYVQALDGISWTDEQAFQVYRQAGKDLVFELSIRPGLAPAGVSVSDKIIQGAGRFAVEPQRVAQRAGEIGSEDVIRRSRALGDLKQLGELGAAALVNALADPQQRANWPRLRGALRHFRDEAAEPLIATLRGDDPRMQREAAQALGSIPLPSVRQALLVPALASDIDPSLQALARRALTELTGSVPSRAEAETQLRQAATSLLRDDEWLGRPPQSVVIAWAWDSDSRQVRSEALSAVRLTRNRAYRAASDLMQLNPEPLDDRLLFWLARLDAAKRNSGPRGPLPETLRDELVSAMDSEMAAAILDRAMQWKRIPAAIAACELLGQVGHEGLLVARDGNASPLVRALTFGDARLAHAAARTIFGIHPSQSYLGSSQYVDALVQMARSRGQRRALVAHSSKGRATSLGVLVGQAGYVSAVATRATDYFHLAARDPDLQLLVLTDTLDGPSFVELIQALRAQARTRRLPILLLYREHNADRAAELARQLPRLVARPLVFDELQVARQVAAVEALIDQEPVSAGERIDFARDALDQLLELARDRERYPFYDAASHEQALTVSLYTPGLSDKVCRLLGQFGTPPAQRNLVAVTNNSGLPESLRQCALESLGQAVRDHGVLLTRGQILAQYDRYNASAQEPPETQQILSGVLNVLENRGR